MAGAATQCAAPGRTGIAVAADVAAGAAGSAIRVGEADSGASGYVVHSIGMQGFAADGDAVGGCAGMAGAAAETVVGVTVGFRGSIGIGGRIAVTPVTTQCSSPCCSAVVMAADRTTGPGRITEGSGRSG